MAVTPSGPSLDGELRTERLVIRPVRVEDAEAFLDALGESHSELQRWMDWATSVPTLEVEREWLAQSARDHESGTELRYAMWRRSDGAFVGAGGFPRPRRASRAYEIGYWVRTSQVGNGFATEFAGALTTAAFTELQAKRVEIRTSSLNGASRAVAEHLGYRHEHTRPGDGTHADGTPRDTVVYAQYAPVPAENEE